MADRPEHLIEFRVKHKPDEGTVRFRITVLDQLGRTVVYRGKGRYSDPDAEPTFNLKMHAEPIDATYGAFRRMIAGPASVSVSVMFGDLYLDPSEPMTRTVKPKPERADG